MKAAVVLVRTDLDTAEGPELAKPQSYDVWCPLGTATVYQNQDVIFYRKDLGTEWYAIVAITDKSVRVETRDEQGQWSVREDPLFECRLVARTPYQKLHPTYVVGKTDDGELQVRPAQLGDIILIPGSTIASKALKAELDSMGRNNSPPLPQK